MKVKILCIVFKIKTLKIPVIFLYYEKIYIHKIISQVYSGIFNGKVVEKFMFVLYKSEVEAIFITFINYYDFIK